MKRILLRIKSLSTDLRTHRWRGVDTVDRDRERCGGGVDTVDRERCGGAWAADEWRWEWMTRTTNYQRPLHPKILYQHRTTQYGSDVSNNHDNFQLIITVFGKWENRRISDDLNTRTPKAVYHRISLIPWGYNLRIELSYVVTLFK